MIENRRFFHIFLAPTIAKLGSYQPSFACKTRQLSHYPEIISHFSLIQELDNRPLPKIFAKLGSFSPKFCKSWQVNCMQNSAVICYRSHAIFRKIFDYTNDIGNVIPEIYPAGKNSIIFKNKSLNYISNTRFAKSLGERRRAGGSE